MRCLRPMWLRLLIRELIFPINKKPAVSGFFICRDKHTKLELINMIAQNGGNIKKIVEVIKGQILAKSSPKMAVIF